VSDGGVGDDDGLRGLRFVKLQCADQLGMLDVAGLSCARLDSDRCYGQRYSMGELHAVGVVQAFDQCTLLLNHIDGFGKRFQMLVGVLDAFDNGGLFFTPLVEQLENPRVRPMLSSRCHARSSDAMQRACVRR